MRVVRSWWNYWKWRFAWDTVTDCHYSNTSQFTAQSLPSAPEITLHHYSPLGVTPGSWRMCVTQGSAHSHPDWRICTLQACHRSPGPGQAASCQHNDPLSADEFNAKFPRMMGVRGWQPRSVMRNEDIWHRAWSGIIFQQGGFHHRFIKLRYFTGRIEPLGPSSRLQRPRTGRF